MSRRETKSGFFDEIILEETLSELDADTERDVRDLLSIEEAEPYLYPFVRKVLGTLSSSHRSLNDLIEQLNAASTFLHKQLGEAPLASLKVALPAKVLRRVATVDSRFSSLHEKFFPRQHQLHRSQLFANERTLRPIKDVIIDDILSADEILVVMAFIKTSGVAILRDALARAIQQGVPVQLVTSLYMQAHDAKAIQDLAEMGVDIRIDLDVTRSDLHAKGWLFRRHGKNSTAIIGSSNLSAQALGRGREWNLRVSEQETPHLIEEFDRFFRALWDSDAFTPYNQKIHPITIENLLRKPEFELVESAYPPILPMPHQEEALRAIDISRAQGQLRNLVVAATGTGKTAIAAIDYARFCEASGRRPRMLFVAHRREILQQAQATFRRALQDDTFGELWVGNDVPTNFEHLFVSIQTLTQQIRRQDIDLRHFEYVVIDEFHHAQAPTYRKLIDRLGECSLIGLTATPERMDGINVQDAFFGGRITYELRLVDALNERLLVPFHYFGVADGTDLSKLSWSRTGYVSEDLDKIYTGNDIRLNYVLQALSSYIDEPDRTRAIGFCVSVAHAEYMSRKFNEHGLASTWLSGNSNDEERESAIQKLKDGNLQYIFVVDLFNEGVDIPCVNTLLLLRPTQSITLFTQQLGRGLRVDHQDRDKTYCVVLDFIGQHRKEFLAEVALQTLTNAPVQKDAFDAGFPTLPPDCLIHLEPVVQDAILERLAAPSRRRLPTPTLWTADARPARLLELLGEDFPTLHDLYRASWANKGITQAQAACVPILHDLNQDAAPNIKRYEAYFGSFEGSLLARANPARLLHIDDHLRIQGLRRIGLGRSAENHPVINRMICSELLSAFSQKDVTLTMLDELSLSIQADTPLANELLDIATQLERRAHFSLAAFNDSQLPYCLHATYTRGEVVVGFATNPGGSISRPREGVFYNAEKNTDFFFVTLNKDDRYFAPSTSYRDYAISPKLFASDSQNSTSSSTPTGARYVQNLSRKVLFARTHTKVNNEPQPFRFLGEMRYLDHEGEKPMHIRWKLEVPLPIRLFSEFSAVTKASSASNIVQLG